MSGKKDFFSSLAGRFTIFTWSAVFLMGARAVATPAWGIAALSNGMNRNEAEVRQSLPVNLLFMRQAGGSGPTMAQGLPSWQQISFTPIPPQKAKDILNASEVKDLTHLNWEIDKKNGNRLMARLDKTQQKNLGNPSGPQIENMIPGVVVDSVPKGGGYGLIKDLAGTAAGLGGTLIPGASQVSAHVPNSADSASNKYLFSDPAIILGPSPSGQRGPSEQQVAAIKKYADAIGHQLGGFPADAERMFESANSGLTMANKAQTDRANDITHRLNIDTIIFKPAADGVGPVTAQLTAAQAKYFTEYLDEAFNGGKGMTQEQFFGSGKFTYTPEATAPTLGAITGGKITVDPAVTQDNIDALVRNRTYIKALSDSGPEMVNTIRALKEQSKQKAQN